VKVEVIFVSHIKVEVIVVPPVEAQTVAPTKIKNDPGLTPVNRDAAKILRPMPEFIPKISWSPEEKDEIRWAGLISKCPACGGRGYEGGYCFDCGRALIRGTGIKKSQQEL
jgi:hypothetical protein